MWNNLILDIEMVPINAETCFIFLYRSDVIDIVTFVTTPFRRGLESWNKIVLKSFYSQFGLFKVHSPLCQRVPGLNHD